MSGGGGERGGGGGKMGPYGFRGFPFTPPPHNLYTTFLSTIFFFTDAAKNTEIEVN